VLAHLSSNPKQIFPLHSSEYVEFDDQSAVIDAIHEVYLQSAPRSR
jgi:hypothetical protein